MMKKLLLAAMGFGLSVFVSAQETNYGKILLTNHSITTEYQTEAEIDYHPREVFDQQLLRIIQLPGLQIAKEYPGFKTLEYLPKNAFVAVIDLNQHEAAEAFLRSKKAIILPFKAEWKLSHNLFFNDIPDWAWLSDSEIEISLRYVPGYSPLKVRAQLQQLGYQLLRENQQAHTIAIAARPDEAAKLARLPFVLHLQEKEDPGTPENFQARASHRVSYLQADYNGAPGYDGDGVTIGHGDDGAIGEHIDFKGRLIQNAGSSLGDHGDHVAGTIFGAGNRDPDGRGMAPAAEIYYQSYPNNLQDADQNFVTQNVRITSSSYSNGCNAGYTNFTAQMDQDAIDNPEMIHVFSAGNSGTQNCSYGAGSGWGNVTGGHKIAKNVIAVANLTSTDGLANSSSRGPASDGRIKPDVGAVGTSVYSTTDIPAPNSYTNKTGTSMACPGVSGVLATLYQAYRLTHGGNDPAHAGLLKAILMNTAEDLGGAGPDFRYGYGRVNARSAAEVIENNRWISDSISSTATTNSHVISLPSQGSVKNVRIMLYWPDAPASTVAARALVNDLDLSITHGGVSYQPWVLDPTPVPANLNSAAVQARDSLNNAEQITISNPSGSSISVDVSAFNLPAGSQEYFITYQFEMDEIVVTYPAGGESLQPFQPAIIRWDAPRTNVGNFTMEYSVDSGQSWTNIGIAPGGQRYYSWSVPNTINGKAKVRVSRGGNTGETPGVFSIIHTPANLSFPQSCPDSATISWDSVNGAEGYIVYQLGAMYMDSIGYTTNTSFQFAQNSVTTEEWFSVAAMVDGVVGKRAVAVLKPQGLYNCILQKDLEVSQLLAPGPAVTGGCFPLTDLPVTVEIINPGIDSAGSFSISYRHNNGQVFTDTINQVLASGDSLVYTFNDSLTLNPGYNSLKIWISYTIDQNPYNDTLIEVRSIGSGVSQSLPYFEGFDNFNLCNTATNCGATVCGLKYGWQNLSNNVFDEIDWRTHAGATPSNNTGPSIDHSLGNISGRYLYLESSGGCDSAEAILMSPCLDLDTSFSANIQMEFWYHMYGGNMGTLSVDLITEDSVVNNIIPTIQGVNLSSWQQVVIDISAYGGQQVVVRFRGKTGNGFESDLAIDDFKVYDPTVTAPTANFSINAAGDCVGDTVVFSDSSNGAINTYQWSFGNGASPATASTAGPHQVVYNSGGRKTVQLTVTNAGGTDFTTMPLDVDGLSNSLFVYGVSGGTVNFTAISSFNPTAWLWDFGDGDTSSQKNPSHTYTAAGTFYVTLTTTNSCGQFTRGDSVSVNPFFSLEDSRLQQLSLYPNPNQGSFKLRVGNGISTITVYITDLGGKLIYQRQFSTAGNEDIRFDSNSLPAGVYFVNVETEVGSKNFRMVVKE